MRIIGIDQSTTGTGLSLLVDGKLIDYWLIKPKGSKRAAETMVQSEPHLYTITMPEADFKTTLLRTTAICDIVEKLIDTHKPDKIYFEEIYYNNNASGFRSLGRLQGFLAHIAHKYKIPYVIVEETKWINSFDSYGSEVKRPERKADIMKKINDRYGLEINTDDVSDAIAIGVYASSIEEKENKNE